jgi:predicted DNA-binding protein
MVRTQIQLTEEQSRRLKASAARQGISVAELIRRGIEAALGKESALSEEELSRRAIQAAGKFHSGRSDVSRRHDEYLGEAYQG